MDRGVVCVYIRGDVGVHRHAPTAHRSTNTHLNTPPQALDGPGGVLQGLEARMLGAVWQVYKDEAPHSGRSELLYGACVRACDSRVQGARETRRGFTPTDSSPSPKHVGLARLAVLLLKRHPRLLHEPVAPQREDLEANNVPGQQQAPQQADARPLPLYRQAIRLLRERRKAGSKLASRLLGQELKLAALILSLLGKEAARRRRRGRGRRRGGEGAVVVDGQYVRDEARLLLEACHRILGAEEQQGGGAGKDDERQPVVAGGWWGGMGW